LLPAWALLPDAGGSGTAGALSPTPASVAPAPLDAEASSPGVSVSGPTLVTAQNGPRWWVRSGRSLTSAARAGGARSGRDLSRSAGRYVRAKGGARTAARRATGGRAASAALGQFLSNIASNGLRGGLDSLGLGQYVGAEAEVVIAAIVNAIGPAGASREEAAARAATNVVLEELYHRFVSGQGGQGLLEGLTAAEVRTAVTTSIAEYVYTRWLSDLGRKVEDGAVSAEAAVKLERDMRSYVREAIVLDLGGRDPLTLKWHADEGRTLVEGLYEQAFHILEGDV
jgi:hypothetical protein